MITAAMVTAFTAAATAVKRKAERDECPKRKEDEPPKKRPPLLSLDGTPRLRLEDNPLRKKRKLFDTNDEPVLMKKKVRRGAVWHLVSRTDETQDESQIEFSGAETTD